MKDERLKGSHEKKYSLKHNNKENQITNTFLNRQTHALHFNDGLAYDCIRKNEFNWKNAFDSKGYRHWEINDTPIGKIHDISQEI